MPFWVAIKHQVVLSYVIKGVYVKGLGRKETPATAY